MSKSPFRTRSTKNRVSAPEDEVLVLVPAQIHMTSGVGNLKDVIRGFVALVVAYALFSHDYKLSSVLCFIVIFFGNYILKIILTSIAANEEAKRKAIEAAIILEASYDKYCTNFCPRKANVCGIDNFNCTCYQCNCKDCKREPCNR